MIFLMGFWDIKRQNLTKSSKIYKLISKKKNEGAMKILSETKDEKILHCKPVLKK